MHAANCQLFAHREYVWSAMQHLNKSMDVYVSAGFNFLSQSHYPFTHVLIDLHMQGYVDAKPKYWYRNNNLKLMCAKCMALWMQIFPPTIQIKYNTKILNRPRYIKKQKYSRQGEKQHWATYCTTVSCSSLVQNILWQNEIFLYCYYS